MWKYKITSPIGIDYILTVDEYLASIAASDEGWKHDVTLVWVPLT